MVRTLKDVGPYSEYTYVDFLEVDGLIKDSIDYGTTRVARGASPSYPSEPANPFFPGNPWTEVTTETITTGYNKEFRRYFNYNTATIMTLSASDGYFTDVGDGSIVTSIDITGGGTIRNNGDSGSHTADFSAYGDNFAANYRYTFSQEFDGFYINGVKLPLRADYQLPTTNCTLNGVTYVPKWTTVQFGQQWGQGIYQQIISGQTCLSGDSMASFEYMMGDPDTAHLIGFDYYTNWQTGDTVVMPFVTDPNGQPTITSYYCYTSSDLSAGTWAVLNYTLPSWSEIHRHGDTTQVDYLIKNRCNLTTNEFYDGIYALANGIDPNRPLPS